MLPRPDFSYAMRVLAKSPGFTSAVVLSLALGIGANSAIFSAINGILLHPSGINNPQQLVAPRVSYKKLNLDKIAMSATDFANIRDNPQVFSSAALCDVQGYNYTGGDTPQRLQAALVSWQWFEVFGRNPMLGRAFHPEEDQPGANHVTVLSFSTWEKLFGGDPKIIGRTIELNKISYRVIGVMPANFRWPSEADLWAPIGLPAQAYGPDNLLNENYFVVARLAPGVTYARAASFVDGLSRRVLDQVPYARGSQWSMELEPFTNYIAGDLRTPLLILLAAVALVLLIACSNIAGLMLARATGRSRELAVRTALGAGRADLIVQALTETSLLALGGTALGVLGAFGLLRALLELAHAQLSRDLAVQVDGHVLVFAAGTGLASALLFGLTPSWHVSRLGQQHEQLKSGGRSGTEGSQRQLLRSALVAGQIALAMVLLVGSGLLVKTLARLGQVRTGFGGKHVITASLALPPAEYASDEKQLAFYHIVLDKLSQTPGVMTAAAADTVPFSGGDPTASFGIEGRIVAPGNPGFHGSSRYVSPEYFRALQIPLLAGRYFNDADRKDGLAVAIIDVDLARRYWPDQNPIGKRLRRGSHEPWATIVGIVGHVKQSSLAADAGRGAYYFSLFQQPQSEAFLVARGRTGSAQLEQAIRNAVRSADPAQALFDFKTMEQRIALALGPQQFASRVLIVFAAAALLLATIGLYGVVAYNVTRRTREIGIRAALGARQVRILGLVLGHAMRLVLTGVGAGLIASALLGRLAATQLFGVSPMDPETLAVTAAVLTLASLLASALPAWRAARVSPLTALRSE